WAISSSCGRNSRSANSRTRFLSSALPIIISTPWKASDWLVTLGYWRVDCQAGFWDRPVMSPIVRSLVIIVSCQVGGMSLWFSASAAMPRLIASGEMSAGEAAWMTSAVQLGFVAGTLVSAIFGLADRCEPRRVFCISALAAAVANAGLLRTGFAGW